MPGSSKLPTMMEKRLRIQPRPTVSFLVSIIFVTLAVLPAVRAQCYFPGEIPTLAANYTPCYPHDFTSVCCLTGWTCFDNNACIATDPNAVDSSIQLGTVMRGACTNPMWNDTACGDFCLDDPVSDNSGTLTQCSDSTFCCSPAAGDGSCDCGTGKGTFEIPSGNAVTVIGQDGLDQTSVPPFSGTSSGAAATSSSAGTSTPSAPASTTASSTSRRTSLSSTLLSSQTGSSTSKSTTTSSPSSSAAVTPPSGHSTAVKAGIGIGATVASLAVIGGLGYFFYRWHRRRQEARRLYPARRDSDSDIFSGPGTGTAMRTRSPIPHPFPSSGPPLRSTSGGAGSAAVGGPTEVDGTDRIGGRGGYAAWRPQTTVRKNIAVLPGSSNVSGVSGSATESNSRGVRTVYEGT